MSEISIQLTEEENALLRRLVETELGDTRVEVHRTHLTPDYRERAEHEEDVLRRLLDKLPQETSEHVNA